MPIFLFLGSPGVDQACAVSLKFSGGRLASFIISGLTKMPAVAEIVGEKGTIRLRRTSICPTEMETPHGVREIQLPPTSQPCNYINSSGLRYEADEVRRCLLGGKKQILIANLLNDGHPARFIR